MQPKACFTSCGVSFHMSQLYLLMVLSVENLPLFAQLKIGQFSPALFKN